MTETFDDIPERHNMQTVAFYNVENLFDLRDGKFTNDGDFLPESVKRWTSKRYKNKLRKIGFAISNIGRQETGKHPAIVGLAEIENAKVLKNLLESKHLETCNYDYVHFDSLDERGIDVAMLYDTTVFEPLHTEIFAIILTDENATINSFHTYQEEKNSDHFPILANISF